MIDWNHDHAELGEATLHYVTAGAGAPVVLLHGWPQTWYMWRKVIPALAERYRVIAPDLRGLGDSSRPAGGYDKLTIARDIGELVLDHLDLDAVHLVGHDWGGPVAFALAAARPDRVARLALLDVPIPGDGMDVFWHDRWHHAFHWIADMPRRWSRAASGSTWSISTATGAPVRTRSRKRRSGNMFAPIPSRAPCGRVSTTTAPRPRTWPTTRKFSGHRASCKCQC